MRWLWSLSAGITMIRDPHPEPRAKAGPSRIGICILITKRAVGSLAGLCSSIKRV
jgi:hypothetical protein